MRVLVLGGGGREHALCWALARSDSVKEVWCAPGNAGTAGVAQNLDVDPTDVAIVRELAVDEGVDLVVVGPEGPLVAGVADALTTAGVPVFGPTAAAAQLEGSKAFAKDVMTAAGVPTAAYWTGRDLDEACAALQQFAAPYVVKADGLAAGKGVRICADIAEAEAAINDLMVSQIVGGAGSTLVIEEFLEGPEVSVFALCDARGDYQLLPAAQDFKRVFDGQRGPNTGGMGAYAPVPLFDAALRQQAESIVAATLAEMSSRGSEYVGVLYVGCVATTDGLKVLEYNARFGDPEAQVLLPLVATDVGELLLSCVRGELGHTTSVPALDEAAVTVVLASGGYPGDYETGLPIDGLEAAAAVDGAVVFHAGTRVSSGRTVTAGGRVLAVTGVAPSIEQARHTAYAAADLISFEGMHRRTDIAASPSGT